MLRMDKDLTKKKRLERVEEVMLDVSLFMCMVVFLKFIYLFFTVKFKKM